jgi:hypothetical protein
VLMSCSKSRRLTRQLLVLLMGWLSFTQAIADNTSTDSGWAWSLAPLYYWSINIDVGAGTSDPDEPSGESSVSFEGALSGAFSGVYDNRWGFDLDLVYVNLSNQRATTLDFKYLQTEALGFYRSQFGAHSFDWLAGARYYVGNIELIPPGLDARLDWLDPVVGIRWNWGFADKWSLRARADVGGFGVGSDLTTNGFLLVDWRAWQHAELFAGMRAESIEYEFNQGSVSVDLEIDFWGPLVGVNFVW